VPGDQQLEEHEAVNDGPGQVKLCGPCWNLAEPHQQWGKEGRALALNVLYETKGVEMRIGVAELPPKIVHVDVVAKQLFVIADECSMSSNGRARTGERQKL